MQTRVKAMCAGVLAAFAAFVPSFALFDWALITYWEWQHEGRKMKFTLWADDRAFILTLFLCAIVSYVTVRYSQRHLPIGQQIKRPALVIDATVGMVVVYFAVVAYFWMVVRRFSS